MKKLLSFFAAGLLFTCISCDEKAEKKDGDAMSPEKKENSMAEKNLAASRAVTNAFGTGDTGALDSVIADDFVDHTDRGDKKGRDSLKAAIAWVRADSKDMKAEIKKELADEEYVMSWIRFTGISKGGMGKPGPYDVNAIQLARFKDGKAVEHWEFMQVRDMMKMMAEMPMSGK